MSFAMVVGLAVLNTFGFVRQALGDFLRIGYLPKSPQTLLVQWVSKAFVSVLFKESAKQHLNRFHFCIFIRNVSSVVWLRAKIESLVLSALNFGCVRYLSFRFVFLGPLR